jgi:protein-S-isoprenylcysteine O-methyltransferase Ste14
MLKLIIFVIVSTGIVVFSWKPLRNRRSHGFFRFFVFECLVGLILLNAEYWFYEPFFLLQIFSWLLLLGSIFLAVHGFYLLRIIGKPKGDFESTTMLVRRGAYNYIRHPLYSSLLFLGWGAFLKNISLWTILLVVITTIFVFATAKAEEKENLQKFGAHYADYIKTTRMFIPFII